MLGLLLDSINDGQNFYGDVKSKFLYSPIITKGKEQEIDDEKKEEEMSMVHVPEPRSEQILSEDEYQVFQEQASIQDNF